MATYTSPSAVYTVQLTGKSTAPTAMFVEHLLYAHVFKGSVAVVRNWQVHFADMLDTAFEDQYTVADWMQENVLRFKASAVDRAHAPDVIVIENRSRQPLAFLSVKSVDLFLVFDLAAGASMQLSAPAQATLTDLSWVVVDGQWTNGTRLSWTGVNFRLPQDATGQCKYIVTISDTGTNIREVQRGAEIYR